MSEDQKEVDLAETEGGESNRTAPEETGADETLTEEETATEGHNLEIVQDLVTAVKVIAGDAWVKKHGEKLGADFSIILDHHEELASLSEEPGALIVKTDDPVQFTLVKDGDQWMALLGADLQEGKAGFGTTPEQALVELGKDLNVLSNEEIDELVTNDDLQENYDKLQAQYAETLAAHAALDIEYQKVYSVLISLARKVLGEDELVKHAPLTPEVLETVISDGLDKTVTMVPVDNFNLLDWIQLQEKHLTMIGHGPLAMGRYEGAKDTYTMLKTALRKAGPKA
jgi:hypothetical protein